MKPPEVSVSPEIFGTENVVAVLDVQADNLLLNISISSNPEHAVNTSSTHFTIPYNTPTNVSVIADLCGMHNATMIRLNYGECMWYP